MTNLRFLKDIFLLIKGNRSEYFKGFFISVLLGGVNILLPISILKIFDDGIGNKSIKLIIFYSLFFILLTLCSMFFSYKYTMIITSLENNLAYETRCTLIDRIFKMRGAFFNSIDNGEIYTMLYSDVEKIPAFLTKTVLNLIKDVLTLLGLIFFMSKLQLELLIILITFQIFIVIVQNKFKSKIEDGNIKYRDSIIEKNKISQEIIFNIFDIICAKLEHKIYSLLSAKEQKTIKYNCSLTSLNLKNKLAISFINALMIATILCFGGIKVALGQLSVGALVTFNIFSQKFISPINSIYRFPTEILDYKLSWSKIKQKIIGTEILEDTGCKIDYIDKITFNKVSFKYNDMLVLEKCEFELKNGNMYALVGLSGSGKSTIVKLIFRLWDEYQGNICANNTNIRDIRISSLRSKISYLSQDIFLLNGTLRENLQSKNNEPDDCLIKILYKVNLGLWFEKLKNGLDTNLGENGARISGGEKQRIVIARAILQKPQVLILDEATSMLDEKTEENILSLIKNEFQSCLIIFITHRLKSINCADSILVLDKGKIVETGTFKELINNSESLFGKMHIRRVN